MRLIWLLCALLLFNCHGTPPGAQKRLLARLAQEPVSQPDYDPLAVALASEGMIHNYEATVPPQCYTATAGVSNPCWTCHTHSVIPNEMEDWILQEEYAFSDFAMTNRWTNLFKDRRMAMAEISDQAVKTYIQTDNYTPLMQAMTAVDDYPGYRPDLDFRQGFDAAGFARDGSGWRAIRYKPFLGTFWPTNGNTDDVFIRLPAKFRALDSIASRDVYKVNLAILEALIAGGPDAGLRAENFHFQVEPINESVAGQDLNGDGEVGGMITEINGLPRHYAGDAKDEPLRRYVYPPDTEFLHSVRYLDPDQPGFTAQRMKELRYSRKVQYLDSWAMSFHYEMEYNEKEAGTLPQFAGSPQIGLLNSFGWQLQGFIEDAQGRLRLQTHEEHQYCMGCHSAVGVTVDQTFTLARKVPGAAGWQYQNPTGIPDVPQQGHDKGEILTYFERVGGGDEFRANSEVLANFFADGKPRETLVRRAAPGGDRDITYLIYPSRERAIALNKAYMALVREQDFRWGRDTLVGPVDNIHERIENGSTDLAATAQVFKDGVLWLDWSQFDPAATVIDK